MPPSLPPTEQPATHRTAAQTPNPVSERYKLQIRDFFHRTRSPNSADYYSSEAQKIAKIFRECSAYVAKLREQGRIKGDPLKNADPAVLNTTRAELVKGTRLEAVVNKMTEFLLNRVKAANQMQRAATDKASRNHATSESNKWTEAFEQWSAFLNSKIGEHKVDIFEFDIKRQQVGVIDPSLAWGNQLHNLKSEIYLLSFLRLLGWTAGTAIDVGSGAFQSRIFNSLGLTGLKGTP